MPDRVAILCAWHRPAAVMGILNVTPDSFSDGGRWLDVQAASRHGQALIAAGAMAIDVGGESTRPGAQPVSEAQQIARVVPVIRSLRAAGVDVPITIDTRSAAVAEAALDVGADGINDVSAGSDPELFTLAARRHTALVLMHAQGTPDHMQDQPQYGAQSGVVAVVRSFLASRCAAAQTAGVDPAKVLLDPGIGFGKTVGHNLALLRALPQLAELGCPLVVGLSRKRFLASLAHVDAAADRDGLSHIAHALIAPWCAWLRVHDVSGARRALAQSEFQP